MEHKLFAREIERLRDHYGEKQYSDEMVRILWNEFGQWHVEDFRKIVLEFIATRSIGRPPLRDDFHDMAAELEIQTIQLDSKKACAECSYGGVILTKHIRTGHEMVWSCNCELGKSLIKKIQNIKYAPNYGYFIPKNWADTDANVEEKTKAQSS